MYLAGPAHPHKADAQRLLEACVARGDRLVTDVEVLQEILHRYAAINRRDMIQPAFDALLGVVDEVFPWNWPTWNVPKRSCSSAGVRRVTRCTSR